MAVFDSRFIIDKKQYNLGLFTISLSSFLQIYFMAIAYRQQVDDDTEFAIWKIEEEAEELYSQLQLDEHEKAHYEQLKVGKRNLHWLGTRVLLQNASDR